MPETSKKHRIPIIHKNSYKSIAACFPIVMLIVSIFAIIQTIYNCQAYYIAYGTTLTVYESFIYCGALWGTVSILLTFVWWMLVGVIFIIGHFIGDAKEYINPQDNIKKDRIEKTDDIQKVEEKES